MSQKKPSAFMKPVYMSKDLEAVVGEGPMPRTEITKKVWDYIKANNLQDANNKRNINPDDKLAKVFGSSQPVDMFKMTSIISSHLSNTATA
ncbi:MAG: SWIB/MDM2 domain-containing protein [Chlamydiota bacterium]